MTTREQNSFLAQTGPTTPMGNLVRRYWIPALLSSEIAEPDCPPVRVKLLGERLIAFRDSMGRLGVMDEFCAHRGVSLWFGRKCRRSRSKAASARRSSSPPMTALNAAM
jgi:phthalate 4,5-dioxygenase